MFLLATQTVQLYADAIIGFPMHRFVHLAARFTRVYQYRFSYQGRFSHTYFPKKDTPYGKKDSLVHKPVKINPIFAGVVHHDDLLYLLTGPYIAPIFRETDPERITVERLTRMWASFAYRGWAIFADLLFFALSSFNF